jgi:hypothetical protein
MNLPGIIARFTLSVTGFVKGSQGNRIWIGLVPKVGGCPSFGYIRRHDLSAPDSIVPENERQMVPCNRPVKGIWPESRALSKSLRAQNWE